MECCGMSNDHWDERNRTRRARKRAREAAERRHQELKEAWRRRRAAVEADLRWMATDEGGPRK